MTIWICACVLALGSAVGIWVVVAREKRRLLVNSFAFPVGYWCGVAMLLGPFVFVIYVLVRRKVVRTLIESAWDASGPAGAPITERLPRLSLLVEAHLLSPQIFSICLQRASAREYRRALTRVRD